MSKKPYIVSFHSFQGSMRESVGEHFVASLSEDEVRQLNDEADNMHEDKDMYVEPVNKILNFSSVLRKLKAFENDDEDEDED